MKKLIVEIPKEKLRDLKLEAVEQEITLRQLVIAYLDDDS